MPKRPRPATPQTACRRTPGGDQPHYLRLAVLALLRLGIGLLLRELIHDIWFGDWPGVG
jgi:hypothetical protein